MSGDLVKAIKLFPLPPVVVWCRSLLGVVGWLVNDDRGQGQNGKLDSGLRCVLCGQQESCLSCKVVVLNKIQEKLLMCR